MYLRDVNLNLLPMLLALLRTKSVSGAASALGISQPAVSAALSRLRNHFGDDLLVRIGGSMKLTPTASALLEPLEALCAGMNEFLRPEHFEPAQLQRDIVVATSDICAFLLARPMLAMLQEWTPGISLRFIEIEHDLTARMAAREIDFVLLPDFAVWEFAPAPLCFMPLLAVDSVVLMRKGHPLTQNDHTTEAECAVYPHIIFQPEAVLKKTNGRVVFKRSIDIKVAVRVGHVLLVPHLVIDSDAIAIVPRQLAQVMSSAHALDYRPLAEGFLECQVGLAWSPVYDRDAAHTWIRESLLERLRSAS